MAAKSNVSGTKGGGKGFENFTRAISFSFFNGITAIMVLQGVDEGEQHEASP